MHIIAQIFNNFRIGMEKERRRRKRIEKTTYNKVKDNIIVMGIIAIFIIMGLAVKLYNLIATLKYVPGIIMNIYRKTKQKCKKITKEIKKRQINPKKNNTTIKKNDGEKKIEPKKCRIINNQGIQFTNLKMIAGETKKFDIEIRDGLGDIWEENIHKKVIVKVTSKRKKTEQYMKVQKKKLDNKYQVIIRIEKEGKYTIETTMDEEPFENGKIELIINTAPIKDIYINQSLKETQHIDKKREIVVEAKDEYDNDIDFVAKEDQEYIKKHVQATLNGAPLTLKTNTKVINYTHNVLKGKVYYEIKHNTPGYHKVEVKVKGKVKLTKTILFLGKQDYEAHKTLEQIEHLETRVTSKSKPFLSTIRMTPQLLELYQEKSFLAGLFKGYYHIKNKLTNLKITQNQHGLIIDSIKKETHSLAMKEPITINADKQRLLHAALLKHQKRAQTEETIKQQAEAYFDKVIQFENTPVYIPPKKQKDTFYNHSSELMQQFIEAKLNSYNQTQDVGKLYMNVKEINKQAYSGNLSRSIKETFNDFMEKPFNNTNNLVDCLFHDIHKMIEQSNEKQDLVDDLKQALSILNDLKDPDVIGNIYQRNLSQRLLKGSSVEWESSIFASLQHLFTTLHCMKIKGMMKDLKVNESHSFDCLILTKAYWPLQSFKIHYPPLFKQKLLSFEHNYNSTYDERKIEWNAKVGHMVLLGRFPSSTYHFVVNEVMGFILLMFNNADKLTINQFESLIIHTNDHKKAYIKYVLHALCRFKLLTYDQQKQVYTLLPFKSKNRKIDFHKTLPKSKEENEEEQALTREMMIHSRRSTMDATLMRLLKKQKEMMMTQLIHEAKKETIDLMHVSNKFIKQRITHLIDTALMYRDPHQHDRLLFDEI